MNCFYHQSSEAVGLCKCCSKGLCAFCATDLGHGLACKDKHEEQVKAVNMIIEKNAQAYAAAPKNSIIVPIFYLFMGLVFSGFGYTSRDGVTGLLFILGIGFIVFGAVIFVRNQALFGNDSNT